MTRLRAAVGSLPFLLVAPGVVAGLVPAWTRPRSAAKGPFSVRPLTAATPAAERLLEALRVWSGG